MLTPEDRKILERLNAQDPGAVNVLFEDYYEQLYSFASYMISNSEVAHDLVQDVFVRIWENRSSLNLHTSLRNYMFSAVRNNCLNHLKSLNVEDRHNRKWLMAHIESETVDVIEDAELRRQIDGLVSELPSQCRDIFSLRYYEGFSYKEISMSMNVSESVVKVQLHRAVKKLREKLHLIKDPGLYIVIAAIISSFTDL